MAQSNRPLRVLSLDGGGIRGVIQIEILKKIQEKIRQKTGDDEVHIADYFDVIGGTCTGGIIALCLAKRFNLDEISKLYRDMSQTLFKSYTTPYDATPLKEILKEKFGDEMMSAIDETTRVIVACVKEASEPELVLFTNYKEDNLDLPIRKVARATWANPGFYNPATVKTDDPDNPEKLASGYLSYNPTLDILTKISERERNERMQNGIMVSLGTGIFPVKPHQTLDVSFSRNIWGYVKAAANVLWNPDELLFEMRAFREAAMTRSGHLSKRARSWCKMIDTAYHRLEPHIGKYIDIDCNNADDIEYMIAETRARYLHEDDTRDHIDNIANRLVRDSDIVVSRLARGLHTRPTIKLLGELSSVLCKPNATSEQAS